MPISSLKLPPNPFEFVFCFLTWSVAVLFSLFKLHQLGNQLVASTELTENNYGDLEPGWFQRYKDVSDFEWHCWTRLTIRLFPWLLLNFALAVWIRSHLSLRNLVNLGYSVISLLAVCHLISLSVAALFFLIVISFYFVNLLKKPLYCVCLLAWLWRRYVPSELLSKTDEDQYLIEVSASWIVLRCLAYSFEVGVNQQSFSTLLGFALYLPTLFCGPYISITGFVRNMTSAPPQWTDSHSWNIFRSFIRCLFWFFFTNVALHFIYANAILLRPYIVMGMTNWELAGLGIALGHFFHLKYVVFYGLPSCWAAAEGYSTPDSPCCVSRVYLYSVMWRRFDPGLYSFLVRYIYVPVLKPLRTYRLIGQSIASFACFLFVHVWHGEEEYVLYWVLFNFSAVTIERFAKEITQLPMIKREVDRRFSVGNQRRLHCILAAPLHYFSMLANYFFIGSLEVGKIYFYRALRESTISNLCILIILYGAAQTSLTMENWETSKTKHY